MNTRHDYAKKDTISIYQFMEMCGLECGKQKNIQISHEAMVRKVMHRYRKFPEVIALPVKLPFHLVTPDEVRTGKILLVEDDYQKLIPYKKPQLLVERVLCYTEDERKKIQEELEKEKTTYGFSTGYLKYLLKKNQRELETEKQMIQEELLEDQKDASNGFTENQVKVRKFGKRVY